jgi:protocatechuate 3,4-dioxygenase beta subunit
MKRGRIAVAGALVAVIAGGAAVLWHHHHGRGQIRARRDPAHRVVRDEIPHARKIASPWMVERGIPDRHVAGHVVDDRGAPVAGATVTLHAVAIYGNGAEDPQTTTDASGAFDLGDQPPATVALIASGPELAPVAIPLSLDDPTLAPSPDHLLVRLSMCRHWIDGRIHDADGAPIAHARVQSVNQTRTTLIEIQLPISAMLDGAFTTTPAAPDGSFHACAGTLGHLIANAPGYGSEPVDGPDVLLRPAGAIDGLVTDEAGAPLGGVLLSYHQSPNRGGDWPFWLDLDARTVSAMDGTFHFDDVRPWSYDVRAVDGDHIASGFSTVRVDQGKRSKLTIVMSACPRHVAGHVLFSGGEPAAGIKIEAFPGHGRSNVFTQDDGSFVLTCVARDAVSLVVFHDYVPIGHDDAVDDLVITIDRRATISGHVRLDGRPAAGVTIQLRGEFGQTATDGDGFYRWKGLPAGTSQIIAKDEVGRSASVEIDVAAGQDRDGVDLELTHRGRIDGRVIDAAGGELGGLRVIVETAVRRDGDDDWVVRDTKTDDHGEFALEGLRPDTYRIRLPDASPSGDAWPQATIAGDGDVAHVDVAIRRASMNGTVVLENGTPVPFALVSSTGPARVHADRDGHFHLDGLADGPQQITAVADDGSRGELRDAEPGPDPVTIRIQAAGVIEGTVSGADATAKLMFGLAKYVAVPRLLGGSTFREDGLKAGDYRVAVITASGGASASVHLEAGQTVHVDLTIAPLGHVSGIARGFPSLEPVPGAHCMVANSYDEGRTQADDAGRFQLDDVIPGDTSITCIDGRADSNLGHGLAQRISVPSGGTTNVEVYLPIFTVLDDPTPSPRGIGAKMSLDGERIELTQVDADGPAAQAGLATGDQLIVVSGVVLTPANAPAAMEYLDDLISGMSSTVRVRRGDRSVDATLAIQ